MTMNLGNFQSQYQAGIDDLDQNRILSRIWAIDHTVWKHEPTEITNRLGWLHIVNEMQTRISEIQEFVQSVLSDGYTQAVLLGMGGSSLAPELFARIFGVQPGYLQLSVLDSTDPGAVQALAAQLDLPRCLFVVSTKSGTTEETLSFFKYFYNALLAHVEPEKAGSHFVAITDPGTHLVTLADRLRFRKVFQNNPNIGGRYSALSYFGLVPAAFCGVDLELMLIRATNMVSICSSVTPAALNPAAQLGSALGNLACAGRNKLTIFTHPAIASFGDWVEQLVAESTGKEDAGIVPIIGEPVSLPQLYGSDRLFVMITYSGDTSLDQFSQALQAAGHPVIHINLTDMYDLGGQFFLWELTTAIASYFLRINPFDQPNVESAKKAARAMVAEYQHSGRLPSLVPALAEDGISVFGETEADTPGEALRSFLSNTRPGDYIALQAFIKPDDNTAAALNNLRENLLDTYHLATTVGYGPRFLHSTGQLHKGDSGRGWFIQLTADHPQDILIPLDAGRPESIISFGILEYAQALGDRQALLDAGRHVLRLHLAGDVAEKIRFLASNIQ